MENKIMAKMKKSLSLNTNTLGFHITSQAKSSLLYSLKQTFLSHCFMKVTQKEFNLKVIIRDYMINMEAARLTYL
jgi:hypothetical protein